MTDQMIMKFEFEGSDWPLMITGDAGVLSIYDIKGVIPARPTREDLQEAGKHTFIVDAVHNITGSGVRYELNDGGSARICRQLAACRKKGIKEVSVVIGRTFNLECLCGYSHPPDQSVHAYV